jgi:hydroxymethylpyrimidine/phosphomethylpyrimidine kinase
MMPPYVLTIAGFDPSSGAGLSADIKSFECCGVYGLAACTANTIQSHDRFVKSNWTKPQDLFDQIKITLDSYPVSAAKIGIVENADVLFEVIKLLKRSSIDCVVWDPVVRPSADGAFRTEEANESFRVAIKGGILSELFLITPNIEELRFLVGNLEGEDAEVFEVASNWARDCAVLCKSAISKAESSGDLLFTNGAVEEIRSELFSIHKKHGSGCVLSAVITAQLAKGLGLIDACSVAKRYVERFLISSETLLGFHI